MLVTGLNGFGATLIEVFPFPASTRLAPIIQLSQLILSVRWVLERVKPVMVIKPLASAVAAPLLTTVAPSSNSHVYVDPAPCMSCWSLLGVMSAVSVAWLAPASSHTAISHLSLSSTIVAGSQRI